MYDAIVVGARCAGAPTAMLLARKGYRVLLADRATFPSDIPHGHFIHRGGPARLQRWGVLDALLATGCPPMRSLTSDYGDYAMVADDMILDGVSFGYGPRRAVLDEVLVRAAVDAGAELREGYVVEEFLREGEPVTGVRGRTVATGMRSEERAAITIGADGRNSRLARAVSAPIYAATPPLSCWYFSYWSGIPADGLELYVVRDRAIFAFPTHDSLFAVMVEWPAQDMPRVRMDIEGEFRAVVARVPDLAQRLRQGRREERFQGATDLPNFLRRPYGPGWALVGDAGCHKDPFLALGICDAFRDADFLAVALDDAFSGLRTFDAALADYHRKRDEATYADYMQNLHFARFQPPPPDFLRLRAAVRGNPEATRQLLMALEGRIPRDEFFAPERLASLMAART